MPAFPFPNGARFAFTIVDDTDVATVDNVRPIYRLLERLGMRTTKTVWPVGCPEGSRNFSESETLEDDRYREFVVDLARRGFEITWHGATMESSKRERTVRALERFEEILGEPPRIHINHSHNRENIYWGSGRLDSWFIRRVFERVAGRPGSYFLGAVESSEYFWGDLCSRHITYGRNLTTSDINTAKFNPSMPYRDPRRPLIPWWFSASDAEDGHEFNQLLAPEHQERLEREGGFCIVATHLGKDYTVNGEVNPRTVELLEMLSKRRGWFPTVGQLLDWLRARRAGDDRLPPGEWRRMQWTWAMDLAKRKMEQRRRGLAAWSK